MNELKRILILTAILPVTFVKIHSQPNLPVFTQYGECFINAGYCKDVKVKDTIAYVGSEAGLLIFNIKYPDHPVLLDCFFTDRMVFKVFVTESLAFVTHYSISACDLSIIDISDVNEPVEINSFELPNGYENIAIYVQNNYLFLGMDGGFNIFDISDLSAPQLIHYSSEIDPHDMVVRDDFVYMVANYRYFGILDISTISNPELLCWIGDYTTIRSSIDLQGEYAYVAGNTLDIFDINNPSNPFQLCEMETNYLFDIVVSGDKGFTISEDSLYVLDLSDTGNPAIVNSFNFCGNAFDFENGVLVASKKIDSYDKPYGTVFINVDTNWQLSEASLFITDKARDISNSGNYAFVSNGYSGLKIIDLSSPTNPVAIANCLNGYYVVETIVENGIAWVRTMDGFKIVDVSTPGLPFLLGSYDLPAGPSNEDYSIEKYGQYIYLGGNWLNQVYIIDVSDVNNPTLAGQFGVNDWSPDIEITGDYLYVAGYWGGMQIFDLYDPQNPQLISQYPMGMAIKIAACENAAFISGGIDYPGGIVIFDLSNIYNPIYTITYPIGCMDLQCFKEYLFVGKRDYQDINSSILIFNMEELNNPQVIQEINDVAPNGIFFDNNRIYAAEDFKFKIFGDSLTVSNNERSETNQNMMLTCFPNPITTHTTIQFYLKNSDFAKVSIYNYCGEIIIQLINDYLGPGLHTLKWSGQNNYSMKISSGIYILELQTTTSRTTKKLLISE